MCEPGKHKFRTNIDALNHLDETKVLDTVYTRSALSPYVTIIFCEKCGFIAHDTNSTNNDKRQIQLQRGKNG